MLIGVVPIRADNYNQLMYRVMTGEYVWPRQLRRDLPEAQVSVQVDKAGKQRARELDALPGPGQAPGGRHRRDLVLRNGDRVALQHLHAVEHPVRGYHVPVAESPLRRAIPGLADG